MGDGPWGRDEVLLAAMTTTAVDYWQMFGKASPELQHIAKRVLGTVSGACASERGHKWMNMIKSKSRNRLSMPTTEMLLYVRCNLDLVNRSIDYTSSTNAIFALKDVDSDDEDEEEMPSAWRVDDDEAGPVAPPPAAVARSEARGAHLHQNMNRMAVPTDDVVAEASREDEEIRASASTGGRRVRRPTSFQDMVMG